MLDRSPNDDYDEPVRKVSRPSSPFPPWLAKRLLRGDETVAHVYGPRFNPFWERYVTHPLLLLVAAAFAAVCWLICLPILETKAEGFFLALLFGIAVVVPTLIVVGIASGYFTRLVVTNNRLFITQGYEMCGSWNVNRLPYTLLRYRRGEDGEEAPSVDLDALKSMLGGTSDKIVGAKGILALGKQLDRFTSRDGDRS